MAFVLVVNHNQLRITSEGQGNVSVNAIKYFWLLVVGVSLLFGTLRSTTAASWNAQVPSGGSAAGMVIVHITPRCFTYQHGQRATITVSGLPPYRRVNLEWAVTAPHSSGGLSLGPGVQRATAHGIVHISYPAPTQYFSDINRWVLTVFDPRSHPLASVHFRVVEGHPAYLPPTGPSQSCR